MLSKYSIGTIVIACHVIAGMKDLMINGTINVSGDSGYPVEANCTNILVARIFFNSVIRRTRFAAYGIKNTPYARHN